MVNDRLFLILEGVTDSGDTERQIAELLRSPMYKRVKPFVVTAADKPETRMEGGQVQGLALPTKVGIKVKKWVGGFGPDLKRLKDGTSIGRVINGGCVVVLEKLPQAA